MTQEEIKNIGHSVMMNYLTDGNPEGDFKRSTIGADDNKNWWIQGANFVNERQPYSVEDMFWFYMWMSTKGTMLIRKGLKITTTELLKLWEESRK